MAILISQHEDMLERYIVASVVQDGEKIILGKKAKGKPPYPDVWHTPGGGVEDFEKAKELFEAKDYDNAFFHEELQREIAEELGIKIKNIKFIVPEYISQPLEDETENKHGEMTHYYFLEYLCDYAGGEMIPDDDLAEAKWVTKKELPKIPLTPPSEKIYKALGWL